jgi:DNA (cytosine-5)-methyltransferase 1
MKAVSLFAGVGGFDLALERNGAEVVATCEIDKHAQKILTRHFPNTQLFSDVTTLTEEDLFNAGFNADGIIVGGFPCQDLSVAGKRRGLAGERSGLFFEVTRLLAETKAEWFILENVTGLLSSNGGRDMGIVIGALAELGYGVAYRVLDAQFFGVPQRRRRVFIIGCLGDNGRTSAEILALSESRSRDFETGNNTRKATPGTIRKNTKTLGFTGTGFAQYAEGVGTLKASGGDLGGGSETLIIDGTRDSIVRRLTPIECERLQGFPDNWTAGQTDGHRYKQMGNAVAVPVVSWLLQRLMDVIKTPIQEKGYNKTLAQVETAEGMTTPKTSRSSK